MEQFDLKKEVDTYISKFEAALLQDTVSLLEWFYNIININMIFEDESISNALYKRLIDKGYKEINNLIEELECFKRLMKREADTSAERIGYSLISLIMKNLHEHTRLTPPLIQFIEIYNETYNQERTYASMMNLLHEEIGKSVTFVAIINGQIKLLTGIIESVEDYKSVTISGEKYPFIGFQVAISKITSNFGKILYNNSHVALNDKLIDVGEINRKNEETFGANIKKH